MTPESENKNQQPEESVSPEETSSPPAESSSSPAPAEEQPRDSEPMEPEVRETEQDEDEEDFASLLDQHLPGEKGPARGEVIEVMVVDVRDDSVLVDFGGKAEASIPIGEFRMKDGKRDVAVNQMIPVVQTGMRGGTPVLSHRQARNRASQAAVEKVFKAKEPIKGIVTSVVRGGLMVDIGLDAFMPASQVDISKVDDLNALVGKELEAYVTEMDQRRNRAVVSRRNLLIERRSQERRKYLESLEPDQVLTGKVKSSLDFGVFVDLGVIDGFVPREEVSWDRGSSPQEALKPGTEIEVKVLNVSIDKDKEKVTLSRRRLTPNPWETAAERYPANSAIKGKVVAIESYGAFVYLEEGLTGMIHASDMSWNPGNVRPQDYVRVGEDITCQVLEVDEEKERLSLGLKQLTPDPWSDIEKRFPVGSRQKGTVTSVKNYGAFVRLDEMVEGMVHVSDLSWERRVGHPKDHLKVNDEVEVQVLKFDHERRRISLGIKQLQDSPFDAYVKKHPQGSFTTGKVTRFASFGAFVELADGLEGLIHISQIDTKRVEVPEEILSVGEEVTVKILSVDRKKEKISLSRRDALRKAEKDQIKPYLSKHDDSPGGMSLGDALRDAQQRRQDSDE